MLRRVTPFFIVTAVKAQILHGLLCLLTFESIALGTWGVLQFSAVY
jgi:hypothetical protein